MATNMNSNTHKVVVARYYAIETLYAVPMDWNVDDISVMYEKVYYKGKQVEVPSQEVEGCTQRIIEEADEYDLEDWFDCEEETMTCSCGYNGPCDEFQYAPSDEDERRQQLWGRDLCHDCYRAYEDENQVGPVQCPISGP